MTETVTLRRDSSGEDGTFGVLLFQGEQIAVTCELPWRNNQVGRSCIPKGTYLCAPHNSPKHPDTWEVTNVPNRSAILIHSGNDIQDLEGCIAVGDSYGFVEGLPAVMHSQATMNKLRELLPSSFTLEIL